MTTSKPQPTPDAPGPDDDRLWYKDAVIYELHIKAFHDANGDGIGDFAGLIDKLDHVQSLGVNTIWLLPFYPSPLRDDGYDVADFTGVNPAYGTVADVARLVAEAHGRGLRVITELVVNHTSDQHPWFQAARRAPRGSPERNFYVWSDDPTAYAGTRIIFTDTEKSNWSWDEVAQQYYWHRFFSHQPDLNFDNPAVRAAVFGVMAFWLDQGVDGFRLDAIPYLVEREGTSNENLRETHEVIKELRARMDASYSHRLLLAEANMWPEDVREYFGDDDECHMAYHFPLMPRMYMAIAQEDRHPVVEILQQTPDISPTCQWAIFLRNHDELTLEMVTSKERDYMYNMYAADPRARINLGIRRRLAPLLENDRDRIKLMNSLLLSMPGSPVLYYGDEIGMGDNIFLGDRDGVRTPMQWTSDRNGGFSRADPQRLYLPPIQDPIYGYEAVNVEAQARDASSMLNWTRRQLAVRSSTRVFGRGGIRMLHPGNRKVLAYLRELGSEVVLCVANLSRAAQPVELDLARFKGRVPVEMGGQIAFPRIGDQPYMLTLASYGFYWFRLATDVAPPAWHADPQPLQDLAVLVLFDGWNSLFRDRVVPWRIAMAGRTLAQFEDELLPAYLARQRWFAPEAAAPALQVLDHAVFEHGGHEALITLVGATGARAGLPWFTAWSLAWEEGDDERARQLAPTAMAKVRMQARMGWLGDAFADEAFCRAVVQRIGSGGELPMAQGVLRFAATRAYAAVVGHGGALGGPLRTLAPGTVVMLGEQLVLKALRRVREGTHLELEFGRHLTEELQFEYSVPLAGSVEYVASTGAVSTLLLLQPHIPNQGDAWALVVEALARQLERYDTAAGDTRAVPPVALVDGGLLLQMQRLGQRSAALHTALSRSTGNAAFDPEAITGADLQRWTDELRAGPAKAADLEPGIARCRAWPARVLQASRKIRVHGALRLNKLLLVNDNFVVIDFAGDPSRPPAERRAKQSPLRDVASLLHSFELARRHVLRQTAPVAAELARREALSLAWLQQVRAAFLGAYAEAAVAAGLWPDAAAFDDWRPLLELFELDLAARLRPDEPGAEPGEGP